MVDAPRQLRNALGMHAEPISAKEPVVAAQGGRGVAEHLGDPSKPIRTWTQVGRSFSEVGM